MAQLDKRSGLRVERTNVNARDLQDWSIGAGTRHVVRWYQIRETKKSRGVSPGFWSRVSRGRFLGCSGNRSQVKWKSKGIFVVDLSIDLMASNQSRDILFHILFFLFSKLGVEDGVHWTNIEKETAILESKTRRKQKSTTFFFRWFRYIKSKPQSKMNLVQCYLKHLPIKNRG